MAFSSISFIFFFLPVFFLLYYLLRGKGRVWLLFLFSLLFYSWGEVKYLPLMLAVILVNYAMALLMDKSPRHRSTLLTLAVAFDVLSLFFYKYFTPFMVDFLRLPKLSFYPGSLPLGISFFTFQAMSYVIDAYRGDTKVQRDPVIFGTYITMFPQLIAGPIVRYADIETQIDGLAHRTMTIDQGEVSRGIQRFILGLSKKVLLANVLGEAWRYLSLRPGENGLLGCWFGALCYCLQIYFDFSGYSDMAIGLGRMMGFSFPLNFDHPYTAASVTEFWRRWHMTLSRFFREYVYIPLGGNRKGTWRTILNMLIVWSLTGLWHGASFNYLLWGLYFWVLLVLERYVLGDLLKRLPGFLRHGYMFLLVTLSFMVFYFEDLGQMCAYFAGLFRFGGPLLSADARSVLGSYWAWVLLGLLCMGYLPRKAWARVAKKRPRLAEGGKIALLLVLFLLCVASLAGQSYNPFIYFRF